MPLSPDEQKLLEDLTAKSKEEAPDETFEIEVYDTANGRGARVPFSQGKKWLWDNLGLGEDPTPKPEPTTDDKGNSKVGYFGRNQSDKNPPKAS